jgi:exonuclease III
MITTVHRSLKIIAFNANGIRRQAYEARKQLQDLKIDTSLFSETHLKPHMRFYISNYDTCQTDCEDGHRGRTAVAVKKGIPHTCVNLPPLLSVEATGVCMPIGNNEIFLAAVYKSPQTVE